MVTKDKVTLDKYGRALIPKEVRSKLGLREGSSLEVIVRGDEVILIKVDGALRQRVDEWTKFIEKLSPKPFVTDIRKDDSKWLSRKYSLRKLGL